MDVLRIGSQITMNKALNKVEDLKELVPLWKDFHLDTKAKYLGDTIGPGGSRDGWMQSFAKYLERCRIVGNSGLSMISRIILYRMLAFSVTQFHAQFRMPPKEYRSVERKGILISLGGPFNAFPVDFLFTLKQNSVFPISFPSMRVASVAAQARVMLELAPHWRDYYNMVDEAMICLDANLVPAFPNWFSNSVVCALCENDRALEKCGIVQNGRVVHKLVREGLLSDKAFKIQRCIYIYNIVSSR